MMRTVIALLAMTATAAAEPARWSVDVHDRLLGLSRSTRVYVEGSTMRVECEVVDLNTKAVRVLKSTVRALARGVAGDRERVCGTGDLGPVCVEVPVEGAEGTVVQTSHSACATGIGNVGTGD